MGTGFIWLCVLGVLTVFAAGVAILQLRVEIQEQRRKYAPPDKVEPGTGIVPRRRA